MVRNNTVLCQDMDLPFSHTGLSECHVATEALCSHRARERGLEAPRCSCRIVTVLLWEPSAEHNGQFQIVNAGDTEAYEFHGTGSRHRASCMLKVYLIGVDGNY